MGFAVFSITVAVQSFNFLPHSLFFYVPSLLPVLDLLVYFLLYLEGFICYLYAITILRKRRIIEVSFLH